MKNMAGIYRVSVDRGEKPPKFYIGQAVNLRRRELEHLRGHRTGELLSLALKKYGRSALTFSVVLVCTKDMLTTYEQAVLDCHVREFGRHRMLNVMLECVTSGIGVRHRPESIAKMKANPRSPKSLESLKSPNRLKRLREKFVGKPRVHTPETVAKISATLTGKRQSPELVEKRIAHLRGRKQSPEAIAKRVASRLANAAARKELSYGDHPRGQEAAGGAREDIGSAG